MELAYVQPFGEERAYSVQVEEMQALANVQIVQHSRYLTPGKACKLWQNRLAAEGVDVRQLDAEFWLQVRRSTFPLSSLTDQEESELQEFLLRLLETITHTGIILFSLWFLAKLLKRQGGTHIEIKKADDVAINHSAIDKSEVEIEETQPLAPSWSRPPSDVQAIEITLQVPQGYASKGVFIALMPPDRVLSFARSIDYLDCTDVPSELVSLLRSGKEAERCKAAHLLTAYGNYHQVTAALLDQLNDSSTAVRATVIDALAELRVTESVPELIRALEDSNDTIQNLAAIALARIGTSDALAAIAAAFKSAEWEEQTLHLVMQNAYEAITHAILEGYQQEHHPLLGRYNRILATFPKLVTEVILEVLECDQESEQLSALQALEYVLEYGSTPIEKDQIHKVLSISKRLLTQGSFQMRYHTIRALGRLKDSQAIEPLAEASRHPDVNTRAFAVYYLEWYRSNPEAIKHLVNAYQKESHKDLRKRIAELLGKDRPKTRWDILRSYAGTGVLVLYGLYMLFGFLVRQALPDSYIARVSPLNWIMVPFYIIGLVVMVWGVYEALRKAISKSEERDSVYWHLK